MSEKKLESDDQVSEVKRLRRRIRICLAIVMGGLVFSGVTLFPLKWELNLVATWLESYRGPDEWQAVTWFFELRHAILSTLENYPFIAYGTDWLGFGLLLMAILLVGPWRRPLQHRWLIGVSLGAALAILPAAALMGEMRDIPWLWRLVDMGFGLGAACPLWVVWRSLRKWEKLDRAVMSV